MPNNDQHDEPRGQPRAFFGRRKGHKLKPRQAAFFDSLLPKLAIDLSSSAPSDLRALFNDVDDVRLEIGFGGGEHMAAEAEQYPRTGFIGSEPFVNGMAKMLSTIEERNLRNIRLHHGDATELIAWLPQGSLARVDLIYPIPGRSGGIGNADSFRSRALRRSHVSSAAVASSALPPIFPIIPPGRFAIFRTHPILCGRRSARMTGACRGPAFPARATRSRPNAPAVFPAI